MQGYLKTGARRDLCSTCPWGTCFVLFFIQLCWCLGIVNTKVVRTRPRMPTKSLALFSQQYNTFLGTRRPTLVAPSSRGENVVLKAASLFQGLWFHRFPQPVIVRGLSPWDLQVGWEERKCQRPALVLKLQARNPGIRVTFWNYRVILWFGFMFGVPVVGVTHLIF